MRTKQWCKFEGVDSDKLIVSQNSVPLAVVYVSGYMPRPPYTFKFFGPELCDRGANSILMIKVVLSGYIYKVLRTPT